MNRILTLIILLYATIIFAQIPDGYYDEANGLANDDLKLALHNIIDNHVEYSYNNLRDFILKATDEDPDNSNNVILLYTGRSQAKNTFGGDPNEWNREHVWAKSHGGFGNSPPAGTDAHHIRPTDVSVNGERGNLDFDMGGTPLTEAPGCKKDGDSFEPRDEVKGDVARMLFYMAVRYDGSDGVADLELVDHVNTYPNPEHGKLQKLIDWHLTDPPDEFELNRNEVIYSYQQNRNPFIDHPEYVELIWGDPNAVAEHNPIIINFHPNPVTSFLNIDSRGLGGADLKYSIISVDGRIVREGNAKSGNNTINLSALNQGLYLLILKNSNNIVVEQYKLMKQ